MLRRRGTSVVELLVALTIAGVVLAAATGSFLRQQRTATGLAATAQAQGQARAAAALLPAQLSLDALSVEDVVPGAGRDTALQFRAAIASGVSCDSARAPAFAVDDTGLAAGAVAAMPHAGDSLWWYRADGGSWTGRGITGVSADSGACAAESRTGLLMRLGVEDTVVIAPRTPLRVTRQERLAIYRAGDGSWQLGLREWSDATGAMGAPQPVAGPFQLAATDGARTGFRYFDSVGVELPETGGARVARVRLTLLLAPSGAMPAGLRDSADVALQRAPP